VASVTDTHHLVLAEPFPNPTATGTYRIANPLDTYNGPTQEVISGALAQEVSTIGTDQSAALFAFFDVVFTNIVTSSSGTVLISNLMQLEDLTVDFVALGVTTTDFIYCPNGVEMGIYQIQSIDDSHHITISGTPFVAATNIPYQIVSAFSVSYNTLNAIFGILEANTTFVNSTLTFQTTWNAVVQVNIGGTVDTNAFSYGVLTSDLTARASVVTARQTAANTNVTTIQNALSGTEKLYGKRYTWIDGRINLKSGLLVLEQQAIAARIQSQADILNQLTKLLAVQSS